ncbi:hypothetical protein MKX01_022044 [Papaver californicum]|nr:hypothetical protein MKX01_022044 [Papaver californicum]
MAPKAKEKPKSSPQQPTVAIEDLFTILNRHVQNSEFEKAVKIADQVLAIAPGDEDALHCKIVALIKADNIDSALSTIQSLKIVTFDFGVYKAYCLYRQNKLDEAMESLSSLERTSATMQLESQIFIKLQNPKIDSIEINIVAGLVSAGRAFEDQGTMNALKVKPNSSFELAYNNACSLIERQKYVEAEHQLLSARRIGQETLMEDNWDDDEIEMELAPIAVQLAYVRQLLGHPKEAIETYVDIITRNLSDDSSLAVAINKLIALKGPKDASDGLRKLDKLIEKGNAAHGFHLARGLDLKLSSKQKEAIYTNRVLLLLHASRVDQLDVIMHEAARFKIKHGREEEATHLYEGLFNSYKSVEALVGLVKTAAQADVEKAETYEKKLKGADVDSLEKTSGAKHVENNAYFPPPDPERWFPKRERSSYRPKRKDKRAQIKGSQGSMSRDKKDANNAAASSTNTNNSKLKPNQVTTTSTKIAAEQSESSSSRSSKKKSRR